MKKILYSILIGMLALSFGCEEPDEVKYDVADGTSIMPGTFTVLDQEVTVNFSVANPDVTELTLNHVQTINASTEDTVAAQGEVATVSISDGAGSVTFNRSDIGLTDNAGAGSSVSLQSVANIEGNPARSFSISIAEPMSLMGPGSILHNANSNYIKYNVVRNGNSISGMTLETKVGASGTYSEMTGMDFNTDANDDGAIIDSAEIVGSDYSVGDTVYYKFTASSSFNSFSSEATVVIEKLAFGETGSFTLDTNQTKAWDLVDNEMLMDPATDSSDVTLTFDSGTVDFGIESSARTEFVTTTADIDYNDMEVVMEEYENNSGSAQSSVTGLQEGDKILYKITHDGDDYYGSLEVDNTYYEATEGYYELTLSYINN